MVVACPLRDGARRKKVRLQATQLFEQDMKPVQVARQLRVSTKSAYQRRRAGGPVVAWGLAGGMPAERAQLTRLRGELDKGPAAWARPRTAHSDGGLGRSKMDCRSMRGPTS